MYGSTPLPRGPGPPSVAHYHISQGIMKYVGLILIIIYLAKFFRL